MPRTKTKTKTKPRPQPTDTFDELDAPGKGKLSYPGLAIPRSTIKRLVNDLADDFAKAVPDAGRVSEDYSDRTVTTLTWRSSVGHRIELRIIGNNYGCSIWLSSAWTDRAPSYPVGLGVWWLSRDFHHGKIGPNSNGPGYMFIYQGVAYGSNSRLRELSYDHKVLKDYPRYHLPPTGRDVPNLVDDIVELIKQHLLGAERN